MKKSLKKLPALLLTLLLALSLAACGGTDDDDDTDLTDFTLMTVEELTGGWVDDDGNQLVIDPDTSTYDYRTWYGRVGFGPFEVVDDRPVIEYDGFYYDFEADGDGFLLRQNGALRPRRKRRVRARADHARRHLAGRAGRDARHRH